MRLTWKVKPAADSSSKLE